MVNVHPVTKSSPSPGVSFLQPPPHGPNVLWTSVVNAPDGQLGNYSSNEQSASNHLKDIHMSGRLMEDFVIAASENTKKGSRNMWNFWRFPSKFPGYELTVVTPVDEESKLRTIFVIITDGPFYVTALIIPKQEATSASYQAINEEIIYAIQNEESLFSIGWIHTHPSKSCFMSLIDLHNQYAYQVMVPEAVGIVLAPSDESRSSKPVIVAHSTLSTSVTTALNATSELLGNSDNTVYSGYPSQIE